MKMSLSWLKDLDYEPDFRLLKLCDINLISVFILVSLILPLQKEVYAAAYDVEENNLMIYQSQQVFLLICLLKSRGMPICKLHQYQSFGNTYKN